MQIRVGEPLRLHQDAPELRRARTERTQVIAHARRAFLKDVQHLQRGETLRLRRHLVDVVALVVGRDRVDPFRLERPQVGHLPLRPTGIHAAHDGASDRAAVEGIRSVLGQELVGSGQVRVPEDAVERGYLAVAKEHLARFRILAQLADVELVVASPVTLDALGQPESLAGGFDRWLQHASQRHTPEAAEKAAPAIHGAGHGRAIHAVERDVIQSLLVVELRRGRCRRPAGGVQSEQALLSRRVVDRFHVAADAGAVRLHDAQHRRRRDRCVRGVAAILEDLQADLRRERLAGRNHTMAGEHLGASLLGPVPQPIAAHSGDAGRRVGVLLRRDPKRVRRDIVGSGERNGRRNHCDHGNPDGREAQSPSHSFAHAHDASPFSFSDALHCCQ